jgi:hypothetical protein
MCLLVATGQIGHRPPQHDDGLTPSSTLSLSDEERLRTLSLSLWAAATTAVGAGEELASWWRLEPHEGGATTSTLARCDPFVAASSATSSPCGNAKCGWARGGSGGWRRWGGGRGRAVGRWRVQEPCGWVVLSVGRGACGVGGRGLAGTRGKGEWARRYRGGYASVG